jgi:hypothetical protein
LHELETKKLINGQTERKTDDIRKMKSKCDADVAVIFNLETPIN